MKLRMIRKFALHLAWLLTTTALPAPAFAEDAVSEDTTGHEPIVVTGTVYRGEVSSGGARIDAEVKDLPLSISVVTEELIDDRQVRNLKELADNVAGVRPRQSSTGQFTMDYTVRGFQGFGLGLAQNGYRVEGFSASFETQNVERVEFLKGPASVLYGASGALTGLVNVVTKTPQSDTFLNIDITGGSPGYGRAGVDANVQLSSTLDFRLNGALTNEKVINAFTDVNAQFIAPSLRWQPAKGVSIIAEGSWFHVRQPTRNAVSYPDIGVLATLPKKLKLGEPGDFNDNTTSNLRLEATWEVAPGLTLRQGVNRQKIVEEEVAIGPDFTGSFAAPGAINRSIAPGTSDITYLASQSELRWNFNTGPLSHKLLVGFEYAKEDFLYDCCDSAPIDPLDLSNPVYGVARPDVPLVQFGGNLLRTKAGYIQDFIEWGQFKALLGVRYDDTTATSFFCNDPACVGGRFPPSNEKAFSPRVGVVWQPSDRTTIFASWAKSFAPNAFTDSSGRTLPPERGEQYEIGLRQDLLSDRRLTLSLAAFDLTRQNILECDPADPNCTFFVAVGEQNSKGAEVELTGKPVPWIDVVATYTYLDSKVTKSDIFGIPVGSKLQEAVPHSASLFTKINLEPLGLKQLAFSVGAYFTDKRPTRTFFNSPDPTFRTLPAFTRIDLGAFWEVSDTFRLQANITNLFDVRILEPANIGFNRATPFRATLGGSFNF
jgi:iron complex outermembrane recepter protein